MQIAVSTQPPAGGAIDPALVAELGSAEHAVAADASQFISFSIGADQYGVDIMAVREIKGWSGITHLPKQPRRPPP